MSPGASATHVARSAVEAHVQTATRELAPVERELWTLAVVAAALDVLLTHHGLQVGLAEGNPIVAAILGTAGVAGLVSLKLAVLGVATLCRWRRPHWGPWVSLALVVPWLGAATVNAAWLFGP